MPQTKQSPAFHVVSMGKFTLLYFATAGFYANLWLFQQWFTQLSHHTASAPAGQPSRTPLLNGMEALLRVLFSILFIYNLLARLRSREQSLSMDYPWHPQGLAIGFILLQLVGTATSFAMPQTTSVAWQLLLVLALLLTQYYLLYKVQLVANRVEGDPFGRSNSQISPLNAGFIGLGSMIWLTIIKQIFSGE